MRKLRLTFLVVLSLLLVSGKTLNGLDYSDALKFNRGNNVIFSKIAKDSKVDCAITSSIVFPELIRYSSFSDFFETSALELAYVRGGTQYADFSIGKFQMKPSFVEQLEASVKSMPELSADFGNITIYISTTEEGKRGARVERLKDTKWQIKYACCFVAIENKLTDTIHFSNSEDKLAYYAAAYNYGFKRPPGEIRKWIGTKAFPYGKKYKIKQVAYSEVALDFYKNYYSSIFKNNM